MHQAIDDDNPSRSVQQQLASTGVATGPEVPKLTLDKCPQAKVFDFEAEAAALIPPQCSEGHVHQAPKTPAAAQEQKELAKKKW